MKKRFCRFISRWWPLFGYLFISLIFLFPILTQSGVPFKYDWNWPLFSMKEFLQNIADFGNLGILALFSRYLNLLLGLLGYIGVSPSLGLKLFLITVHAFSGYGFYLLLSRREANKFVAFISGVIYAFSPYIFIRTVVGFTTSLVAYAALPYLINKLTVRQFRFRDLITSTLAVIFVFAQSQAGVLTSLFMFFWLIWPEKLPSFLTKIKRLLGIAAGFIVLNLPWVILYFSHGKSQIPSGSEATTLNFIASLPHSLARVLMLSDHHITYTFFTKLDKNPLVFISFVVIYLLALLSFFDRKNRGLVWPVAIVGALILPFSVGPTGIFRGIYTFVYNHFSYLSLFRETYHFEFWITFALILTFGLGLNWLLKKIKINYKRYLIMTLSLVLVLATMASYFSFNYFGRFSLQPIPAEYRELQAYLPDSCSKVYYPPSMGFIRFSNDNTADASNNDRIANALDVPYLTDASSVLNLESKEMFVRNRLTSHFLDQSDQGEFAQLLSESGADCVVVRADLSSNYYLDAKINLETDQIIKSKWENQDMLALARSKKNLQLVKQFSDKIYIFKIDKDEQNEYQNDHIQAIGKYDNVTILPITSWATEFSYYKDGWIRGRYAFWRKEIFADLLQDFLYTIKDGTAMSHQADTDANGELYARYLNGGDSGSFEIKINDTKYVVQKESGEERFAIKDLGLVEIKKGDTVSITNLSGENAIADIYISQK